MPARRAACVWILAGFLAGQSFAADELDSLLGDAPPRSSGEAAAGAGETDDDPSASEAEPPPATTRTTAEEPSRVVEEIVVTAQKRATALQDTPISITALSGDDIGRRGLVTLDDLQYQVPNLNMSDREGSFLVTLRGVGLNVETGAAEPAVALHVDGIYQPRASIGPLGMNDIERLEVLRGPQGTLYGRNATGGAINFVLNQPTETFEGKLRVGGGTFDSANVFGVVSGPIVDGLLNARLSGEWDQQGGFVENLTLDRMVGERDGWGGRLALAAFPMENLAANLSVIYRKDNGGPAVVLIEPPDPLLETQLTVFPPTQADPDSYVTDRFYEVKENRAPDGFRENTLGVGTIQWELEWFDVKSVTGLQLHELFQEYENDGTSRSMLYLPGRNDESRAVSQEMNLVGTFAGPWETSVEWILGGYFFDEAFESFIPVDIPPGAFGTGLFVRIFGDEEIRSMAGFGDATASILPWLRVFGGLRYTRDDKDLIQTVTVFTQAGQAPDTVGLPIAGLLPAGTCTSLPSQSSFDDLSPRYGLQVDALEDVMVYVQQSQGYKAGGVNFTSCANTYVPESVDSKEIGIKSGWLDGRLTANFALFFNDYEDFQVFQTTAFEGIVVNADSASVKGAELELRALLPAGFSADFAGSWLDAIYEEFFDTDPANPNAGEQDLSGNQLNRAPTWTTNVGIEYERELSELGLGWLRARTEYFWTDDVVYRPYGHPEDGQSAYSIWNAHASVSTPSDMIDLRVFGKNLAASEYYTNKPATQFGNRYGQGGARRIVGAELTWRF